MKKIFVVFCTLFLLVGCVTQDLSIENRHKITTVTILPASFSEQQFKYTEVRDILGNTVNASTYPAAYHVPEQHM